jgi:ABC-type sugar transport systems, ATPase components
MYHGPVAAQDCFPCGGETWWQGYVESICERPEHALEAAVNGKFSDPGKESSVIGTIATGLFDRIPESQLVSPKVFTEHRCQIPYNAALALRKAKIPVCAESGIRIHREEPPRWRASTPTRCDQHCALARQLVGLSGGQRQRVALGAQKVPSAGPELGIAIPVRRLSPTCLPASVRWVFC